MTAAAILRRLHLDLTLPSSIIIILAFISIFTILSNTTKSGESKISEVIKPVGLAVTLLTGFASAHTAFHLRRRERASDYVKEWRSQNLAVCKATVKALFLEEFYKYNRTRFDQRLFNRCHAHVEELKKNADGLRKLSDAQTRIMIRLTKKKKSNPHNNPEEPIERHAIPSLVDSVEAILTFMEQMGQDVKLNVVDEYYLKDYFYRVVITYYEFLRKYIELKQYEYSCRIGWCNFVYLAQKWEGDRFVPGLPRICRRPLILTEDDLERGIEKTRKGKAAPVGSPERSELAEQFEAVLFALADEPEESEDS